jgi:hypothetical protein
MSDTSASYITPTYKVLHIFVALTNTTKQ